MLYLLRVFAVLLFKDDIPMFLEPVDMKVYHTYSPCLEKKAEPCSRQFAANAAGAILSKLLYGR